MLKLNPETGRKHQLRKQLLIHGCPILGDNKYRIIKKNRSKDNILMLHAFKINFPISGMRYNFVADLPSLFIKTLKEYKIINKKLMEKYKSSIEHNKLKNFNIKNNSKNNI